ncbi:MAG: LysR family transcriptional regulator [Pseudomonadota bacterium]
MYNVRAIKAFVAVAERGSFAAAATHIGMSTSSLSRLVNDLEAWLDLTLLRRSTRHVTLTKAGEHFLGKCQSIVTAWSDLETDARKIGREPGGTLTIAGASYSVRQLLAPHIPSFLEAYPGVSIRLDLRNDHVDLVAASTDVAFRLGEPRDLSVVAKKCGEVPLAMTASPAFLQSHGKPEKLGDLPDFPCLLDSTSRAEYHWPSVSGSTLNFAFEANDGEIIRRMTLDGLGVSMLPAFFVERDVQKGRLVRLFRDQLDAALGVYFVMPERRQILPTARTFVDFASPLIRRALAASS